MLGEEDIVHCLLCPQYRRPLTKKGYDMHFQNTHVNEGQFDTPLNCPQCKNRYDQDVLIIDEATWLDHEQERHDAESEETETELGSDAVG